MHDYVVTRVAAAAVCRLCFAGGTCVGGLAGLALGLLEHSTISIFGGLFLGLVFGLAAALLGGAFAVVFNLLSPYLGGIGVRLEPTTTITDAPSDTPAGRPADETVG